MATSFGPSDEFDGVADRALYVVSYLTYSLMGLLTFCLLTVGTVAIIAELKGTWHWSIHLESTLSYMGVFVSYLLTALVPLMFVMFVGRWYRRD